jgi:glycerol-3-phosphate cytidylyltransferase
MRIITFGTFDLFHIGHFNILKNCKEHGNYLIVGVSTDVLSEKKGKNPVQNENVRLHNVKNNIYVDLVFFEESLEDKDIYIKNYEADILIMGDDWLNHFDWVSCKVIYLPRTPNISTTLLKKNNNNMNQLIKLCSHNFDRAFKSKSYFNKAPNFYSNKYGILNSNLCVYTEYMHTYAIKLFEILNSFNITYYVFAGSAIGLMRDGKNIPWVDDYDIIVKESDLGNVIKALDTLKKNNYEIIFRTKNIIKNGFYILSKKNSNFFNKNYFQCDIFVSFINKNGYLDNHSNWGMYIKKKVPEKFLGEPKYMKFNNLNLPFFEMFDKDITLEYNDIFNSTIIHVDHRVFSKYNLNYSIVYEIFNKKKETLIKDSCNFLDSENKTIPKESLLLIKEAININEYVSNIRIIYQYIKKNNLEKFEITDDTISYIFDLKFYLDKTIFVYYMNEPKEKFMHHLNYIDIVYTNNDSFLGEYFFVRKPIIQKIAAETAPAAEEPK